MSLWATKDSCNAAHHGAQTYLKHHEIFFVLQFIIIIIIIIIIIFFVTQMWMSLEWTL